MRNRFYVYEEWSATIKALPDEMAGRLIKCLYDYFETGDLSEEDPALCAIIAGFINRMDKDAAEYEKMCQKNKKNRTQGDQTAPLVTTGDHSSRDVTDIDIDIELDKELEIDNKNIYVSRPTVEEVRAYCQERLNKVDPEEFVDYYASQNWNKSNGQPLTDWKAAVRSWEKRAKPPDKKRNTFTGFDQRHYDDKELERAIYGTNRISGVHTPGQASAYA